MFLGFMSLVASIWMLPKLNPLKLIKPLKESNVVGVPWCPESSRGSAPPMIKVKQRKLFCLVFLSSFLNSNFPHCNTALNFIEFLFNNPVTPDKQYNLLTHIKKKTNIKVAIIINSLFLPRSFSQNLRHNNVQIFPGSCWRWSPSNTGVLLQLCSLKHPKKREKKKVQGSVPSLCQWLGPNPCASSRLSASTSMETTWWPGIMASPRTRGSPCEKVSANTTGHHHAKNSLSNIEIVIEYIYL